MIKYLLIFTFINVFFVIAAFFVFKALFSKYIMKLISGAMNNTVSDISKSVEMNIKLVDSKIRELNDLVNESKYQAKKLRTMLELTKHATQSGLPLQEARPADTAGSKGAFN